MKGLKFHHIFIISFLILAVSISWIFVSSSEKKKYTLNPNQPIAPGEFIYRTFDIKKDGSGETVAVRYNYLGIEKGHVKLEYIRGLDPPRIKTVPRRLSGRGQTYVKTRAKTYLITVVDPENRITVEEVGAADL